MTLHTMSQHTSSRSVLFCCYRVSYLSSFPVVLCDPIGGDSILFGMYRVMHSMQYLYVYTEIFHNVIIPDL